MVAPDITVPPGVTAMLWPRLLSEPPMQVEDENGAVPVGLISVTKAVIAATIPANAVPLPPGGTASAVIWLCVKPLYALVGKLQLSAWVPPLVPVARPPPLKATYTLLPESTATSSGALVFSPSVACVQPLVLAFVV